MKYEDNISSIKVMSSINILTIFINYINYKGYSYIGGTDRIIPVEIMAPVLLLLNFLFIKNNNIKHYFPQKIKSLLFMMLVILLVTTVFRENLYSSFRNTMAIVFTYLLVLSSSYIIKTLPLKDLISLLINIIVYIVLPINYFIQFKYLGGVTFAPNRLVEDTLRFGGGLYHAHNAMILGTAILLKIFLILTKKSFSLIDIIKVLVLGISLILTDCRSIWLATFLSCMILFLYMHNPKYLKLSLIIMATLITYFYVQYYFTKSITAKYSQSDFEFRGAIWLVSINAILKKPFIGYGGESPFESDSSAFLLSNVLNDPHSAFLNLLLQSGIIVTALFIILYYNIGKYTIKNTGVSKGIISLMIFWIIGPFFWGMIYNGTSNFITFFFPFTIFSILLHPSISMKPKIQ